MTEEPDAGADRSPRHGHAAGVSRSQDPAPAVSSTSRPLGGIHDRVRRIADSFHEPAGLAIARPARSHRGKADSALDRSAWSLSGLRLLMTVACHPDDDVCGDLAFENALSTAGMLFSHGVETVLVAVGDEPSEARSLAVRRTPGVSFWTEALPSPAGGDALPEMTERAGADMLVVHDASLVAGQRSPRPTIVFCTGSPLVSWSIRHGGSAPPDHVCLSGILEQRGLRAADRVIAPSRWFAEALATAHELPLRPLVAAPLSVEALLSNGHATRKSLRGTPLLLTVGRLYDEAMDLATLDRAAGCLDESVMAAGSTMSCDGRMACFKHLQALGGLGWREIDKLLSDAPVFVSAALVPDSGGLLLRAAAHGCSLVLSDIPAHRELWRGAAVFVPPGDHQGFAAAMRRASEDGGHRAAMSEAARRRVRLLGAMRRSGTLHEVLNSLSAGVRLTAAE